MHAEADERCGCIELFAAQLPDVDLLAHQSHFGESRIADMRIVRPHHGLRAGSLEVEQVVERLEHVPVAQIPGFGGAEIHRAIIGLRIAHEPRASDRIEKPFRVAGAIVELFVHEIVQHVHHRRFALGIAGRDRHPPIALRLVLPWRETAVALARDLRGFGVGLVQIIQHRADRG